MGTGWHFLRWWFKGRSVWLPALLISACLQTKAAATDGTNTTNAPLHSDEWVIQSWHTKEGLPENTVYALLQTHDGYLWIGTGGGLARFDGERFRSVGLQDGLGSVLISALAEDQEGFLWVGTRGGGLSRGANRQFKTFAKEDGFPPKSVEALIAGKDGSVWIGTPRGLWRWRNGLFADVTEEAGLPQKHIRTLLEDSHGTLWVSTFDKVYKETSGHFAAIPDLPSQLNPIYSLCEDPEGNIWAGGGNGHLGLFSTNGVQVFDTSNGVPFQMIVSMASGEQGTLWMGTRDGGAHYRKGANFQKLVSPFGSSSVQAVVVDRDANVWLGGAGLNRVSRKKVRVLGASEGLAHRTVTSVAEDSFGNLWASTQNGGAYNSKAAHFNKVEDQLFRSHPHAYTMVASFDGIIWAGGESFLYRYHPEQGSTAFTQAPVGGDAIRALCIDEYGVWAGTYYSALLRADENGVRLVMTNGSFGSDIRSLVRAGPESLWIGSGSGLHYWEPHKLKTWTTRDGLLSDAIQALHLELDGTLWIGTLGGGLARMKDGKIFNVTTRQGLADDVVSQIVADDFGHLWLGCNHGIMRLKKRDVEDLAAGRGSFLKVALIGSTEGMTSEQCTGAHSPTAIKTKRGTLLFSTVDGIVEIDPRTWMESPATIPQADIEDILVDGQRHPKGTSFVIPAGSRHLEVNYGAPSLGGTHSLQFRFRLEPLEKQWVNAGMRRTAYYAGLRPGKYVFRVAAGGIGGEWNEKSTAVSMIVEPYFWQTLWFQLIAAASLCGGAFLLYWRRVAKIEQSRTAQQNFTRQLLASQENERKRIAAELHDGLGQDLLLIKNRVELLASGKHKGPDPGHQLTEISRGASRAIADVRAISHALRPSALEQVGLTKAIEWMGEQMGESSGMRISMDLDNIDKLFGPDEEINVFRIVQEALNNVIKHAKAAEVVLEIKRNPVEVCISVFDNGRGFEPEHLEANGHKRSGMGLAGMRERAAVLNGSLIIQSSPGRGTRLMFSLPMPANRREGL